MTREELAHFFLALQIKNDLPKGASALKYFPAFGIPDMYHTDLANEVMKTGKMDVDCYCKLNKDPQAPRKDPFAPSHFDGQFEHKVVTLDAIENGFKAFPQDILSITTSEAERMMKGIIYGDYSEFKSPEQVWEETGRLLKDNPGNIDVAKEVILERLESKRVYALNGWYADKYNYLMYVDHKFVLGSLEDDIDPDLDDDFWRYKECKKKGITDWRGYCDMYDCEYIPDELYCTIADEMKPRDKYEWCSGLWGRGHYYNFVCIGNFAYACNKSCFTEKENITAFCAVLVPSYGRAKTKGGEIVRAMSQLQGRYSSHGDRFYMGSNASSLFGPSSTFTSYSYLHNKGCVSYQEDLTYEEFLAKGWSDVAEYLGEMGASAYEPSEEDSRNASYNDTENFPRPLSADFDTAFPAPWEMNAWIKFECYGGENFIDGNEFCISLPIEDDLLHFCDCKILAIKAPEAFSEDIDKRLLVSGSWFDSTTIIDGDSFQDDYFGKDRAEGISFYTKGEYDAAIKVLSNLVRGGDIISMRILGSCYNEMGERDKALHYWNKAAYEGDATSISKLAELFFYEGKYDQAKICYETVLEHLHDEHSWIQYVRLIQRIEFMNGEEHDLSKAADCLINHTDQTNPVNQYYLACYGTEYTMESFKNFSLETSDWEEGLLDIAVPDGVTSIENYEHSGREWLRKLLLPETVSTIGEHAFWGCENLREIIIPKAITRIENSTFADCTQLETIELPDSLEAIDYCAFEDCTNLRTIVIPKNVKEIGGGAFAECGSLREIIIPEGVTRIDNCTFLRCTELETVVLPDSLEVIGESAFADCTNLRTIVIPENVKEIGERAFEGCENLREIIIPEGINRIEDNTFKGCTKLETIVLPDSFEVIGDSKAWHAERIGECAFEGCENLREIIIPRGVTRIEDHAFSKCPSLSRLVMKGSVPTLGVECFDENNALLDFVFPDGIKIIGNEVCETNWLHRLTLPDSIERIDDSAFYRCTNLEEITLPSGLTSIGEYAFEGCQSLTEIDIPANVDYVDRRAFADCKSLRKVVTHGATSFASDVFDGCSALSRIEIHGSAPTINEDTFLNCDEPGQPVCSQFTIIVCSDVEGYDGESLSACGAASIVIEGD